MTEDELILTHILQCSRSELYLKKFQLTDQQQQQFSNYKSRRQNGEPLQYILGVANFLGLDFKVDPRVLIPRPETELLVELAIKKFQGMEILDIGTGSGCIAVTLAKHFLNAYVTTIDVSQAALQLAQENARIHKVNNIEFIQVDIANFKTPKKFDLIVSNPPYIAREQMSKLPSDVQHEPHLALEAGEDGLDFYRTIIKIIPGLITQGACLMMEFGDGQSLAVKTLIDEPQIFSKIQIHKDLTGKDRIIEAY